MIRAATALVILLFTAELGSETVDVKDWGTVDLKPFECRDITRSSLIQRVCYDKAQSYLIISIKGVYDHHCELPAPTFDGLMGAPSMGQFYRQKIRGSGSDSRYDCRTHRVPTSATSKL
jgi:KTSC domain-containing protein